MAEFKLGRIRFVWQGDWSTGRAYVADDVVSFGGKSYICIKNHTSSAAFDTDFTNAIPKWDIVSDGTSWQGDWQAEYAYAPGDVVKYGALVYIAETGHTSATFAAPDYLGLEEDLDKWTPFATSFDWKGNWTVSTRFKINDLVKYGGYVYLCKTAHVSAATVAIGLEVDQAKWELFSDGIVYTGDWQTAVRYRVNDVVKYGGNVFIAKAAHTSTNFIADETANWDVFIEGFQFEDSWSNSGVYQIGDTVTYGGYVYVAKTNNTNAQPTASPADWEVFTTGFSFQGDWSSLDSYKVGHVVRIGGTTYVAIADSTDQEPPNETYWSRLNSGVNWTQSTENFSQISGTNAAGGSGSGAKFDVVKSKTVYTINVSTGFSGTGYADNDVITISGADVGGTTPANDIIVTVTGQTGGVIDTVTHTGYSSSWIAGKNYAVGDVAIYGASSFIVVTKHTSEVANRPDNDLTATYWNLLTLGSEALSLEVDGDLVYYGNQGPTRLPIGVDGQVLRATDGFPDWANYGLIDNVVYVGPLGTNVPAPESGLTIDKPWSSVRYALDQIREGYLNPKTKNMLINNKQFLVKEASNWVKYNYNITVTASATGTRTFTCNSTANLVDGLPIVFDGVLGGVTAGQTYYVDAIVSATEFRIAETPGGISVILTNTSGSMQGDASVNFTNLEQDCCYVVDALVYDISRGGTLKTTNVTNSYYTSAGNEYISNVQRDQRVINEAVYAKLKEFVGEVLNNTSPINYQGLMGINTNQRAQQVIDLTLTAEDEGKTKADTLLDIVITGIAAKSNTAIALPVLPNTTVFIKTGTYNEILPMILPEYTAVVGDELRTSVIQPQPAIALLANDKPKSTNALNRIKDVSSEIIQNIAITPTAGNTTKQAYINGYGGTTQSNNRLNNSVEVVKNVLETGLSVVDTMPAIGPIPTSGSNNASDAGHLNAIAQIEANYEFIKKEITAWIAVQVAGSIAPFASNFVYNADKCERDVEYILDALRYDLTYGGNLETTVAARSYFVDGSPVYGAGEKEETLAAYAHLKTIVGDVITETAITKSTGNDLDQNTDGTAGSAGAETFAETRVQEIYDTIDTDGTLATPILPDTSWVAGNFTTISAEVVALKSSVQSGAISWVNTNYPNFTFDEVKCSRDIGYIVDALQYDILFGSTFRGLKAGMAYRRGITSTEVVLDSQLEPTLGTIEYTRNRLKYITTRTYKVQESTDLIVNILNNGSGSIPVNYTLTDPVGYDTGFFNARRLIVANKDFIIAEAEAYMIDNHNALWSTLDSDEKASWLEDVDSIVDSLQYDLTYRGNTATHNHSRVYYNDAGVFFRPGAEKDESLALVLRLQNVIDNIATGDNAGWTKSSSNSDTQDVSGTAGSAGAGAFAADRLGEIYSKIDTGVDPADVTPSVVWTDVALQDFKSVLDARKSIIQDATIDYVKFTYPSLTFTDSVLSRDVGYLIDALVFDTIFDANFLSSKIAEHYRDGTISFTGANLTENLSAIAYVNSYVTEITDGVVSTPGSRKHGDRAYKLIKDMNTVVQNGLEALPPSVFPTAPGFNTASFSDTAYATTSNTTGVTTTYGDAAAQLVKNAAFIQDEIRHWLEDSGNGYDTIWNSISADGQDRCIRDVGYILDAARYDLLYGGNTQSIVAGNAYFSNFVLTISANELPATIAAYGRLKTVVGEVIAETAVTASTGVTETQDTTGTPGNTASVEFAQARIQDVLDHINNATANATIDIANSWQQLELQNAYNRVVARKTELVEDVVFWVEKFAQELSFNQATCRRDAGLIVDALARDLYTGSNFATTKAGMSYYRLIASALKVKNEQLYATVGSIEFLAQKARRVATLPANAVIEMLMEDINAFIDGGELPIAKWIAPSDADANDVAAASIIWENTKFVQAEVIAFISENYPTLNYDVDKCKRDVAYIIDALRYDLTYGSEVASIKAAEAYYYKDENQQQVVQLPAEELTATLAAYDHMKFIVEDLALNSINSPGQIQTDVQPVFRDELQVIGDADSGIKVSNLMTIIYDTIGDITNVPSINIIDITNNIFESSSNHNLSIGDEIAFSAFFDSQEIWYIRSTPSPTTFTISSYFGGPVYADDSGAVDIQAVPYRTASISDVPAVLQQQYTNLTGSATAIKTAITEYIADKFPTLVYDVDKCERDVGYIIDAVGRDMMNNSNYNTLVNALAYYRGTQAAKVTGSQKVATVQSYRELKNRIGTFVNGSAVALKRTNQLMDIIIEMLDKGAKETPEIHGTITYFNDRETINAADILTANKNFLANEATAWTKASYGGTVTELMGSPGTVVFSAAHNLSVNDPIKFDSGAFGTLVAGTIYYVSEIESTTEIQISATPGGESLVLDPATGSSVASYAFDEVACRRDTERYIEAIVNDLKYPGNAHSWRAAELYLNAVNGSERSDMFHVRNATGVRNMTVNGLRGNLTELNDFGTRRPTAGAYVSLDPGFGPNDSVSWVTNKSCYVQNVTTFGVGCVGCKIDGAIHAGGNRSIVSNDFTQVLSDGIGVWCSGNNSLTELVSVFAYYNYSGYLADLGGRIRATNGNSSYGTYGVIAEGTDTGEVPITAQVDNLSQDALVYSVLTDGEQEVLAFEFANTGTDYTNAEVAISGTGFNAAVNDTEFRDRAIVESRIIDLNDGNGTGGEDYVTAQNVAQGGDKFKVTVAATDTALSGAYVGMNIQLTAGTGVGQYGTVLRFNNGTKDALVYKPSFNDLTISASVNTGNLLTVPSTDTLYVNMPIYLSDDIGGATKETLYFVNALVSDTQFTISDEEGGTDVALTSETKDVVLYAAGFDHVIPGKPIATNLDLTTGYTIEPAVTYQSPGWNVNTTNTTASAVSFGSMIYADNKFVALQEGGTGTNYSLDGATWAAGGALPASGAWNKVTYGGGTGATATAVIGGLGGSGAILTSELGELNNIGAPGPTQIAKVTVVNGGTGYQTAPTIVFTPTAGGGGATAVCTVKDGIIQEVIITSTGAGYSEAPTVTAETDKLTEVIVNSFGNNYLTTPTVTITGGGASTQATVSATTNNNGVNRILIDDDGNGDPLRGDGYTSVPTVTITDPGARIVAIAVGSTNNAYLPLSAADNAVWTAGTALPSSVYTDIAFGNGVYSVVGGAGGTGSAATSTDGATWVSRDITTPAAGNFVALAYGATKFCALNDNGFTATSTNGIVWIVGGSLPGSSTDWLDITYGNGRFVAISASGDYAVSVDEGATWVTEGTTLANMYTSDWTSIEYGQGLFLASRAGTSDWASSQDGLLWEPRFESGSETYKAFAFGSPNRHPLWIGASNGANNATAYIKTGATPIGRVYIADGSITTLTLREPGNGYPIGTVASTTASNTITLSDTTNMYVGQPITFDGTTLETIGLDSETLYYISALSGDDIEVSLTSGGASFDITTVSTDNIGTVSFEAGPKVTITDPNSTVDAAINPRIRSGALSNPTFTNRGTGYTTATAELAGDGNADLYQPSTFIAVKGLFELPEPGSNVEFAGIDGSYYKLVTISNVIGQAGSYTATFQVSPGLTVLNAPKDGTLITTTNKYSQVRLTGHDFLYIGTGNQAKTNYPFVDITTASIAAQQFSSSGGRVFFTSTDQDGNFNVGGLFGVQQSTGTATLDADAFNLAGLQSLQLGGIAVGIGSAVITQFSTDPFFTENSDNIVPTQRAIKSYITAQIGGGQSSLNVNTLTAGVVFIANDEITTTSGGQLNIKAKMNFTGGIDGAPVALGYFLSR